MRLRVKHVHRVNTYMEEPAFPYVEDGAQQDKNDGDPAPAPAATINWTWIAFAAAAGVAVVAATAGGFVAYYLYRRIKRLENAPSGDVEISDAFGRLAQNISRTASKIESVDARLAAVEKAVKAANSSTEVSATLSDHSKKLTSLGSQLGTVLSQQSNLEQKLESTTRDAAATAANVSTMHKKLVDTQRFIVEMAQRQKWPWPFNNRIRGLEEEFGLPKSK